MKKVVKKIVPSKIWNILRVLKHNPKLRESAKKNIKLHGINYTIKQLQNFHERDPIVKPYIELKPVKKLVDKNFIVNNIEGNDTKLKIAVAVHIYYLDKIQDILNYIENIPYDYKIYFTVSTEKHKDLQDILEDREFNYEIINYPNQGYDVAPFISLLPRLKELGYDLVCKIHTKKGAGDLDKVIKGIGNLWFTLLMKSILGSPQSIRKIVYTFENNPKVGMLCSAELYKSAQQLMYGNNIYVSEILNIFDNKLDPAKDWGFVAGTMFWADLRIFEPIISNFDELNNILTKSSYMKTGISASSFHAMERIFGLLPQITNMQTALSYAISIQRDIHSIEILPKGYSYTAMGVGTTLDYEHKIIDNYNILKDSIEFDSIYYQQETPRSMKLKMNPILHFLRYGIYTNEAPNKRFSPLSYLDFNVDILHHRVNPLIHYIKNGITEQRRYSLPSEDNHILASYLIKESQEFDENYYLTNNPDVFHAGLSALEHYCRYGYKEDRKPSLEFDVLWYKYEYLRNYLSTPNPLLHYVLIGKKMNYTSRPILKQPKLIQSQLLKNPKRVSLFAAYDIDGLIDESVMLFVKELARHSDVYFLSDSILQDGELDKLKPYTKGAWGIRHGEYDFGSYKRLAQYLVGWDKIEDYDEVILVNDSSYLLKPLDDVFNKMDKKSCSWWGMQATKGIYDTKDIKSNQFDRKISMKIVKEKMLSTYENDNEYDFLVASYFLVFRKPILDSNELQNILNSVKKERNKKNIILNYEIGLTRRLINKGYDFDTYMDDLYPFHPIFTNNIFNMIGEGFPLFKRFFLTENHYHVPQLWQWKEKLLNLIPDLDIKPIEKNLYRVADATKLYNNLHIEENKKNLLTRTEFIKRDMKSKVDMNYWAFPVCAYEHNLAGNDRAVFEEVKNNPDIKKIILIRSKEINLSGVNVEIIPLESILGQEYLLKCGIIFIKHTPAINTIYPLDSKKHKFINLWHGIPLKRIGVASIDQQNQIKETSIEHSKYHSVIASSSIDRMAMASAFYPLTYNDIWVTGLPRNDFILKDNSLLPSDFQDELKEVNKLIKDKKFILYAPTFKNTQEDGYYKFTATEKEILHNYLKEHNIIMGIREHMADNTNSYIKALEGEYIINMDSGNFPNIEVLYRKADLLITDYSSCFIDFMLTGKPIISFAYDYKRYSEQERGLFYDLEFVFAGKICYDFDTLIVEIKRLTSSKDINIDENYKFKQKIFFDYIDSNNSKRLVRKLLCK